MDLATQVREKILSLQDALTTAHPRMPTLLREIHTSLKSDPAVVTLLSEEEIATVVSGLQQQTKTILAASVVKKSSQTKSIKKITLDML